MLSVRLERLNDLDEWRGKARRLLVAGMKPWQVVWRVGAEESGLFEAGDDMLPNIEGPIGSVPRQFIELASEVIQHSDPQRFALLYRLLWRLQEDRQILANAADKDNSLLTRMASGVHRDAHKMKAFVRFRTVPLEEGERYVAWFEPDHFTLEATAPFFTRRFAGMHWGIITPYASAFWDRENLCFGPGGSKKDIPAEGAVEDDWRTYFSAIFNPARLKVAMMKSEMPVKYWQNLPEADRIAPLIRNARQMEEEMIARAATQPSARHMRQKARGVDEKDYLIQSINDAFVAIGSCRRCPLCEHATQPVFGEGPEKAAVMFVGEQPGDQEDLQGRPFIGPAGQVFDDVIKNSGIDRRSLYVTNAVKHFKFVPRGKRRIHQSPNAGEIQACRFWLNLERELVKPKIIVALGAAAAQSLVGKAVSISGMRGRPIDLEDGSVLYITNHPAYLLRIPAPEIRSREHEKFAADLAQIKAHMQRLEKS